ncbi:winged helix-turn-helix transcriptional regulator [Pseudomonas sp. CGJS7]|uniref:winged helix-turn-helix transcriptional regulator n=1 Tax=Pseudomonas sp. CGJS7 TaxID=3109348 RepID=UPI0030094EB8
MSTLSPWNPYASECPTRFILQRVADKWAMLILGLLHDRTWRFNELLRQIEGISQKVLSQTLKRLERDGLILRTPIDTVPTSVEYSLTNLGATLADAVAVTIAWAEKNAAAVLQAQSNYDLNLGGIVEPLHR